MNESLISIIIPIYNAEKYLNKCIDSIIMQTYKNLEIILVNDGSTDTSGTICDNYAATDNRIKVHHKPNGGVSSARNAGIDAAQGEFIAFVDSDDYIDSDMYERLHRRITETNGDICICGVRQISHKETVLINVPNEHEMDIEKFIENFCNDPYNYFFYIASPYSKLYKRDKINNNRFPNHISYAEDLWFNADYIKICKEGACPFPSVGGELPPHKLKNLCKITFENFTPYNYILYNNQASLSKTGSLDDVFKAIDHACEVMITINPEKEDEIKKAFQYMKCIWQIGKIHKEITNNQPTTGKITRQMLKTIKTYPTPKKLKIFAQLAHTIPHSILKLIMTGTKKLPLL